MSTLRVNQVYFNDAANASISIANSWNVSVVSGGQEVAQFRNNGDLVANNRIVYKAGGSNEVALNTVAELAFTQANNAISNLNSVNSAVIAAFAVANTANTTAASAGVPTGSIITWAGAAAPSGFLPCDGNIYTRSTYSALASVLGTPPMLSSLTLEYANTSTVNGFGVSGDYPILAGANNMLFMSPRSWTGNGAVLGNLYTSTDGSTWTPRTAARIGGYNNGLASGYYLRMRNYNYAASNGKNGPYVVIVGPGGAATGVGGDRGAGNTLLYQTSTDQGATWTQRSLVYYRANTYTNWYYTGVVAGGTANAYIMGAGALNSQLLGSGCCTYTNYYPGGANVAWSADGLTFTSFKTLYTTSVPQGETQGPIIPLLAATSNGMVAFITTSIADGTNFSANAIVPVILSQNSNIFWSANGHPSTWTDITANIKTTLGITATSQTAPFIYNIFSCNNEIIMPCSGNRFLVSSNGANGTWRVVKYEGGLFETYNTPLLDVGNDDDPYSGAFSFYTMFFEGNYATPIGWKTYYQTSGIIHNGDVYIIQNRLGNLFYSKDLRTWFRKDDYLTPITGFNPLIYTGPTTLYAGLSWPTAIPSLKKVVMGSKYYGGIFSFTTNGAYTAATQFPVPELGMNMQYTKAFSTSWVPLKAYIKT